MKRHPVKKQSVRARKSEKKRPKGTLRAVAFSTPTFSTGAEMPSQKIGVVYDRLPEVIAIKAAS